MTDPAPDRTIGGPPPRTVRPEPDLSRMIADRRTEAPTQPSSEAPAAQEPPQPRQTAASTPKRAPTATRVARPPASAQSAGGTSKSTTYLSDATRERARAAYRATNQNEDDISWSDFVEKAIAAEAQRRELLYNGGEPYAGDSSRLRAGRPLG
jgi:hypothetical protein